MTDARADRGTVLAEQRTSLALTRTQLAHERTLMAWVRTGTSLISFGFTIYKFFQYLRDNQAAAEPARLIGPRGFALGMIGVGIGALLFATFEHLRQMRRLQAQYAPAEHPPRSPAVIVSFVVAGFGGLVLILVLLRL